MPLNNSRMTNEIYENIILPLKTNFLWFFVKGKSMNPLLQLGTIIFGLVFIYIKKNNQIEFFLKKKTTETEPKPVQINWFRFGFLEKKPGSN